MLTISVRDAEKEVLNSSSDQDGKSPTETMNELTEKIKSNLEMYTIDALIKVFMDSKSYSIANIIFVQMGLYLTACIFKGNQTMGFRFASPTFYPMRSNETQMSSMMFNVLILNLCSMPIMFSVCELMPSYAQGLNIFKIDQIIRYSSLMWWITYYSLVTKGCLFISLLTIVFNVCFGGYRLKFSDLDKKYRNEGKI